MPSNATSSSLDAAGQGKRPEHTFAFNSQVETCCRVSYQLQLQPKTGGRIRAMKSMAGTELLLRFLAALHLKEMFDHARMRQLHLAALTIRNSRIELETEKKQKSRSPRSTLRF